MEKCAKYISDKKLLFKIYKKLLKLNTNKTNSLNIKLAKNLNRYFTKEVTQIKSV